MGFIFGVLQITCGVLLADWIKNKRWLNESYD